MARVQAQAASKAAAGTAITVPASQLGGEDSGDQNAARRMGSSCFTSLFDQVKDLILPSLNFAKAAPLVPAFATPGANPENPKDFFWQHHLGNYLKYLTAQYGP